MNRILILIGTLTFLSFMFAEEVVENKSWLVAERAILTSEVIEREPVDEVEVFKLGERGWLFTDIREGSSEDYIHHIWYYHGEEQTLELGKVRLNIGGPRWRTWSHKYLGYTGDWSVVVLDPAGNIIENIMFKVEDNDK